MSSTYFQNVDVSSDDAMVQELAQAIAKLPATPRTKKGKAYYHPLQIWKSQIERYLPFYPNAANLFSQVEIPPSLIADKRRLEQFVNSTSIILDGQCFPPQKTEILMGGRLYLADEYSGTDKEEMIRLGITHTVCLGPDDYHDKACPNTIPYIEHAVVQVPATEALYDVPIVGIIDNVISFVRKVLAMNSKHKVLIHCRQGDNWSASIAIGIVMDIHGCSFEAAYDFIRSVRSNVSLDVMIAKAVQQWWTLEKLRPELPKGRGYRPFKWAEDKEQEK